MNVPFFSDEVDYGFTRYIGLCTLWTPKSKYFSLAPAYGVCGNLYSRFGIGILIRNVLAQPAIQHVVVTGKDSPERSRHNAEPLLNGSFDPAEVFLNQDDIHEFYQRTKIHDARTIGIRQLDELAALLATFSPEERVREPRVIPLPEVKKQSYPTSRSGHVLRSDHIAEAHRALLHEIRHFGEFTTPDDKGHYRQELWQLTVCLLPNTTWQSIPTALYRVEEAERYGIAFWRGDEPEEVTYRYGYTLRHRYGDQVQTAIEVFQKKPETFRTVLTLWEPQQSLLRDDEPCLITIHPRIRNGLLDMYAYIRTNDMWTGWPMNAAGLRYFQERLAEELHVHIGELTINSGSAHVYDYDLAAIDNYLRQEDTHQRRLVLDPKGNWRLDKREGEYIAEHYWDGLLQQTLRATNVRTLESLIAPYISDIGHAIYIGRELQKLVMS